MPTAHGQQARVEPGALLVQAGADVTTAFAALHRSSPEFLSLALAGLPRGTRIWAENYGLLARAGEELILSEAGRELAAAAAERVPEPYADVTLDDLLDRTRGTIARLRERDHVEIETPRRQRLAPAASATLRLRLAGHHLGQWIRHARSSESDPDVPAGSPKHVGR